MLVDEQIRKCVAFLFCDVPDAHGIVRRTPMGTAFVVGVPMEDDVAVFYLVTARHVIDGTRRYGNLTVRFNLRAAGGYEDFWAPHDTWTTHPTTDVAVAPISIPAPRLDMLAFPLDLVATDEFIVHAGIAEGDEVFFTGLFVQHYGTTRSQPVLRFGNISLMPHEPVLAKIDPAPNAMPLEIDAYLVEARSWGGQSGSPAFIHFHLWRPVNVEEAFGDTRPRLLGLVHGHYTVAQGVQGVVGEQSGGKVPINAGMAIVVPAQKIIDLLMSEEVMSEREERLEDSKADRQTPQPDIAPQPEGGTDYERFEDLTRKLVNTPKPGTDPSERE